MAENREFLDPPNGGQLEPRRRRAKRSDAIQNRERILDAAGAVIAEHGIDAPVHRIADRAGVGIGTLYRNFPDRDALVLGLYEGAAVAFDLVCDAAEAAPTGWEAIVAFIDGVTGVYRDRPWLRTIDLRVRRLRPFPMRWEAAVLAAIDRAWAEGSLRRDIQATDVIFVPPMLQGLFDLPESVRETVIRRQRDLFLDALRAEGVPRRAPGEDVPGEVPTVAEVRESLPGWPEDGPKAAPEDGPKAAPEDGPKGED
ncbi:TetR/AcrR family transcriptional regulator [Agromyces sp. MMS24-JH15]|uniref:TetR/AcrR family transcriptional regulator n=1 Tax=Agromyces sp. MMS24-JH15 TaxID=3243765 RepID=UPI003748F755